MVAGLCTGLWDIALPLGITLELLWLDVVAMGGIIHPLAGMAFLLVFPICAELCWTQPGIVLLPLIMAMISANLGAKLELYYRIRQNRLLDLASNWCRPETVDEPSPEKLILRSICGRILWHTLLYIGCYTCIAFTVSWLLDMGIYPVLSQLNWTFIFATAIMGAVLSLRMRQAYWVLCGSIAVIVVTMYIGHRLVG